MTLETDIATDNGDTHALSQEPKWYEPTKVINDSGNNNYN